MAENEPGAGADPRHHRPAVRRGRRALVALSIGGLGVSGLGAAVLSGVPAGAVTGERLVAEAPLYAVVSEGMSQEEADRLAARLGVKGGVRKDGSFLASTKRLGRLPMVAGRTGTDEDGRATVTKRIDLTALRAAQPLPRDKALSLAQELVPAPEGVDVALSPSHTQVTLSDLKGTTVESFNLDTTVNARYSVEQVPLVGPGMKSSITFGSDGSVHGMTQAVRSLARDGSVGIVGPDRAREECARLYGEKVEQGEPQLVYYAPPLTAGGTVTHLVPHYQCQVPSTDGKPDGGKLVPAAPELVAGLTLDAARDGSSMKAALEIDGGRGPYKIQWSSATEGTLPGGQQIGYELSQRGTDRLPETLSATVTDANGIVSSVSVALGPEGGSAGATGFGGEGGALASVGVVNTVDEWQCAQNSAQGFRTTMANKGHGVAFDWRGTNAWESDFKRTGAGGHDDQYVDSVDMQWYTGHGSPGSFTFKNTGQDDGDLTPSDAQWGDNFNLEWLNLESCQVLSSVPSNPALRWADAFDGLHLFNGFHTNAYCRDQTGGRFASYLFPQSFLFWNRPAMTVQQAWRQMAVDLEPSGVRWRSIAPARSGWVTTMDDFFWGQGAVGPDIRRSQLIGWVAISGVV